MGWKRVKEHYRIDHAVCVENETICIGSPYCYDLIRVSFDGKIIKECRGNANELLVRYQQEINGDQFKFRKLIQEPDTFEKSIPIYTFRNGKLAENRFQRASENFKEAALLLELSKSELNLYQIAKIASEGDSKVENENKCL